MPTDILLRMTHFSRHEKHNYAYVTISIYISYMMKMSLFFSGYTSAILSAIVTTVVSTAWPRIPWLSDCRSSKPKKGQGSCRTQVESS